MSLRARLGWLGGILLVGMALRVSLFGGLLGWDDLEYRAAADGLLAGDWVPRSMFWTRYGLILPLALSRWAFGAGEHAAALVPLGYSLAGLLLAYALGRAAGGAALGLAAAALLALVPLDVIGATDLHTDLPLGVLWAATVYAVGQGEAAARPRGRWYFAAGLLFGMAYLTKEVALALGPVLLIRALGRRREWLGYGRLAGGFGLIVAADLCWLAWLTGSPLYAFSPAVSRLHVAHMRLLPPGHGWMLDYLDMLLDPLAGSFGYFAGIFYLVLAGLWWGLRRGQAAVRQWGLWWGIPLLIFSVAPLDRSLTRPLFFHFARTLHPLLIPFVLTAAAWLVGGLGVRPRLRAGLGLAFAALAAVGTWGAHVDYRAWASVARRLAPVVAREPGSTIVVADPTTTNLLRALLPGRRDRIVSYTEPEAPDPPPDALVVCDPVFIASELRVGHRVPPSVLVPPPAWRKVAEVRRPERMSLRGLAAALVDRLLGWPAPPGPPGDGARAVLWRVAG